MKHSFGKTRALSSQECSLAALHSRFPIQRVTGEYGEAFLFALRLICHSTYCYGVVPCPFHPVRLSYPQSVKRVDEVISGQKPTIWSPILSHRFPVPYSLCVPVRSCRCSRVSTRRVRDSGLRSHSSIPVRRSISWRSFSPTRCSAGSSE